ncbi:hypothetical protein PoB_003805300 [Plakobranchus ocellatus]|uniref:Secreted protein n=1 Tax=Plakobranchus ocellatus TaxID=259542 RepID=A0AAV4AYI3_9GAST|nr:hypothetical protein PoB_003805300 [Plakobranchus ocellatus]
MPLIFSKEAILYILGAVVLAFTSPCIAGSSCWRMISKSRSTQPCLCTVGTRNGLVADSRRRTHHHRHVRILSVSRSFHVSNDDITDGVRDHTAFTSPHSKASSD